MLKTIIVMISKRNKLREPAAEANPVLMKLMKLCFRHVLSNKKIRNV